jgi:putative FmdB family regulatory protein
MPIYEYRCDQGHQFEVMQRMADDPVSACHTCAAPVTRVFHPIAVHFKGSGFYNTDYGTKKRSREKEASNNEASNNQSSSKDSSSSTGSDSGASKSESSSSSTNSNSGSNGAKPDAGAGKSEKKAPKGD